jgi:hypothetical protein
MVFMTKSGYVTHSYATVTCTVTSGDFQERVRSLADEYLDTSLAYSAQAKNKLDLICEMVRAAISCHVDAQLIIPGRLTKSSLSLSSSMEIGLYMTIYVYS